MVARNIEIELKKLRQEKRIWHAACLIFWGLAIFVCIAGLQVCYSPLCCCGQLNQIMESRSHFTHGTR
ncbi:hypothetical protein DCAR_0831816 [Daucus carota subsp. sativus]|uniref:Uncharacterized protein n=1 Tax=Daucus carota subsp. sativus TaxID=79200 RepID=A0AAF0XSH5_DAUCS|nr:hypothetical protein DCAR_0831816 [Daucus carota subsp. sativus]